MKKQISRRSFMKGLLAGSGLTLLMVYTSDGFRLLGAEELRKPTLRILPSVPG